MCASSDYDTGCDLFYFIFAFGEVEVDSPVGTALGALALKRIVISFAKLDSGESEECRFVLKLLLGV